MYQEDEYSLKVVFFKVSFDTQVLSFAYFQATLFYT